MARGDIKRILFDNWDEFLNRYGHRVRPVVVKEVKKVLGCGSFENGYAEYTCRCCGEVLNIWEIINTIVAYFLI